MSGGAFERIRAEAKRRGETVTQGLRHHVLTALVERLARAPEGSDFILRGGLLTRAWVSPRRRATRDLDYVGDFAFGVDATVRRFAPALAIDLPDEVVFAPTRLHAEGVGLDTAFPGVRLTVPLGIGVVDQEVSVDVGFGDPLVPAPTWARTPTGAPLRTVRVETQLAWTLHALADTGAGFRPTDLADLALLVEHVPYDAAALVAAIVAAFEHRGRTRAHAASVLDAPHWATESAALRWRTERPEDTDLQRALATVRTHLTPVLDEVVVGGAGSLSRRT